MGSRKVNTEGIDEELLIASIGRRRQDGTLYHAQGKHSINSPFHSKNVILLL